jgi:hypothetical protein
MRLLASIEGVSTDSMGVVAEISAKDRSFQAICGVEAIWFSFVYLSHLNSKAEYFLRDASICQVSL